MKKLLALSLTAGFAMLAMPSQADACRCMIPPSPAAKVERSQVVFYGKLLSVTGAAANANSGSRTFKFQIKRGYKGVGSKTLSVRSAAGGSLCGANFARNVNHVVYANKSGNTVSTSSCAGNVSGSAATRELPALGQYWAPTNANGTCPTGTSNIIRCFRAPCPVKCMSTTPAPTSTSTPTPR